MKEFRVLPATGKDRATRKIVDREGVVACYCGKRWADYVCDALNEKVIRDEMVERFRAKGILDGPQRLKAL